MTAQAVRNDEGKDEWTGRDLNARLLACKASDLPADLPARYSP